MVVKDPKNQTIQADKNISDHYPFSQAEKKWQQRWLESKTFETPIKGENQKFYCLEMFPYPSGKLHMGHLRNYSIGDVMARYGYMKGYRMLHPMGYDAFGLPAENAAIQNKVHPYDWTHGNIEEMRKQQQALGLAYDWDRQVATCDEDYYKWGQWLFLKFWEQGLVYRKEGILNWCPQCNTVLANEQVVNGLCWRCDSSVSQKYLPQWYVKITDYADELLEDIEKLTEWPHKVKVMQQNWIGRSEGAEIIFRVADGPEKGTEIPVFTTRPDTIFGATYMVLAPEHPLVEKLIAGSPKEEKCRQFIQQVAAMDKTQRTDEATEKEGVFTERFAINPVNNEKIPIWIANYVLVEYGTGAIMAVPTHDQRDFEFARKYNLPMRLVIRPEEATFSSAEEMENAWEDDGFMVNSEQFNGLPNLEGKKKVTQWMEEQGIGKATINYRLRDWGISRQRYWGMPIPLLECPDCGHVAVPEADLPVKLPRDVELTGAGSPLARHEEFVNTPCPQCGKKAKRETDTIDTFWDSSWYFLRYIDAHNEEKPFDKPLVDEWMPVDLYIGGVEHAVLHLLYSRFFTKALRDMGLLSVDEPFKKLLTQGMVTKDGFKMSKSKGNVVEPGPILDNFGADSARIFILFASPPERDLDWSDEGIVGASRFIDRVYRLVMRFAPAFHQKYDINEEPSEAAMELKRVCHRTIEGVTNDIDERISLNTAIAKIMELVNEMYKFTSNDSFPASDFPIFKEATEALLKMLSPFAPHICDELWESIGNTGFVHNQWWPEYDPEALETAMIQMAVQVNGKVRGNVKVPPNADEDTVWEAAQQDPMITRWLEGKEVKKRILVPGKLLNLVVK